MAMRIGDRGFGLVSVCVSLFSLMTATPAFAEKAFVEGACGDVRASIYVERIPGTDVLFVARCEPESEPCATIYAGGAKDLCNKEQKVGIAERGIKIAAGVASFIAAGPGLIGGVLSRAKDVAFVANDVNQLSQELGTENCPATKALLTLAAFDGAGQEKESCMVGGLLQRVWQLNMDSKEFDREPIVRHKKAKPRKGATPSDPADYIIDPISNEAFKKFRALLQAHRQPSSVSSPSKGKTTKPSEKANSSTDKTKR